MLWELLETVLSGESFLGDKSTTEKTMMIGCTKDADGNCQKIKVSNSCTKKELEEKNRTGKHCKLNLKGPRTKSSNEFGEWF